MAPRTAVRALTPTCGTAATPRTTPLLYTGLLAPPQVIEWRDAPTAERYGIAIAAPLGKRAVCRRSARMQWPSELQIKPGERANWTIRPSGILTEHVSGVLWLVDGEKRRRLDVALDRLSDISTPEYRAAIAAMVYGRLGLYQDALLALNGVLVGARLPGRGPIAAVALAHRTSMWVLRTMLDSAGAALAGSARSWWDLRLAYHHTALQHSDDVDGSRSHRSGHTSGSGMPLYAAT